MRLLNLDMGASKNCNFSKPANNNFKSCKDLQRYPEKLTGFSGYPYVDKIAYRMIKYKCATQFEDAGHICRVPFVLFFKSPAIGCFFALSGV
jgi:hypothetical protein